MTAEEKQMIKNFITCCHQVIIYLGYLFFYNPISSLWLSMPYVYDQKILQLQFLMLMTDAMTKCEVLSAFYESGKVKKKGWYILIKKTLVFINIVLPSNAKYKFVILI